MRYTRITVYVINFLFLPYSMHTGTHGWARRTCSQGRQSIECPSLATRITLAAYANGGAPLVIDLDANSTSDSSCVCATEKDAQSCTQELVYQVVVGYLLGKRILCVALFQEYWASG